MNLATDYKHIRQQLGVKRTIGLLTIAVTALFAGIMVAKQFEKPVYFSTISGEEYRWQDEKWTVVNYFAEWCKPCLREIPELNSMFNQKEVRVFGVSFDELSASELKKVAVRRNILFPIVTTDSMPTLPVSMPVVLPTTYIISPTGEVMHTIRGEITEQRLNSVLTTLQH